MKRAVCIFMAILLLSAAFANALAEETTEYSDRFYSFRYPASWNQNVAYDGTIILEIPGGAGAVLTYAVISELWNYTGDPEADAVLAESFIADYAEEKARANGKNIVLSGEYELIDLGNIHGFRAPGTWLTGGFDLIMMQFTYDNHLFAFVFVGNEAIAHADRILASVEFTSVETVVSSESFLRWEGDLFAFDFPDHYARIDYGLKDKSEVIIFANPEDTSNILMARTYPLSYEYDDAYAAAYASSLLPKSTKMDAEPEMLRCGDWNAAVLTGEIESGPLAFYVIGSGNTLLAVIFMGEEIIGLSQEIMASMVIY